jgi:hypothetical protein
MGEIADMMLDGTLDYVTGEYLGEGDGYPRTLEHIEEKHNIKPYEITKWKCEICGRWIHPKGLKQHAYAKHNGKMKYTQ